MTDTNTNDKPPVEKKKTVKEAVEAGVEAFIAKHLRSSDFSRDTPAWNHFQEGLPVLIDEIVKEVKGV